MKRILSVEWISDSPTSLTPGHVRILDQTQLPASIEFVDTTDVQEVWDAIKILKVRGAPAIGVAAAMGVAAAIQAPQLNTSEAVLDAVSAAADHLATSRPTAVNLFWALDRMRRVADACKTLSANELKERLTAEAVAIRDEDAAMCRAIGEHGADLLEDGYTVLTHCNAGGLATSEFGTALAPIYVAHERGWEIKVFADETRPLLQGSRLTAWELHEAGVDVTVITDNVAAQVMKEGRIDAVLVGADRIATNGDAANKIGTYGVATLAHAHGVPFYVLAPTTTIDPDAHSGADIPIEERGREEVIRGFGKLTAPEGVNVYAPAFDVTPAHLITGIVCEKGIARPDYRKSLAEFLDQCG